MSAIVDIRRLKVNGLTPFLLLTVVLRREVSVVIINVYRL